MITLRGLAWNHTRGYTPLVACAQRFRELHPDVDIVWERRSLLKFGETPLGILAHQFDLLVIDHPFVGEAARDGVLLPLEAWISAGIRAEWTRCSVGGSAASYVYDGCWWAAPIDAACPIALHRPDVLERAKAQAPQDWSELRELAARGLVVIPGVHTNAIHHFYMLCHAHGAEPGQTENEVSPEEVMARALQELAELYALVPEACRRMNPIAVHETLAHPEATAGYCPFAFGYSNYSRARFADRVVLAGEPPMRDGRPLVTTLGGAGLALSAQCADPMWAGRFAEWVSGASLQSGIYWSAGGQPAHRAAWTDATVNAGNHDFFARTLPALDRAWVRSRFAGYLHFQREAAHLVHQAACGALGIVAAIPALNRLWREARQKYHAPAG